MSAQTLQAIEDAVQAHYAESYGDEEAGHVTSWGVVWEARKIDDEGELAYRTNYAASEGSPHLAASLYAWAAATVTEAIWSDSDDDED